MGYAYQVVNWKELTSLNESSLKWGRNQNFFMDSLRVHLEDFYPKDWDIRDYKVASFEHISYVNHKTKSLRKDVRLIVNWGTEQPNKNPSGQSDRGFLDVSIKEWKALRTKSFA